MTIANDIKVTLLISLWITNDSTDTRISSDDTNCIDGQRANDRIGGVY